MRIVHRIAPAFTLALLGLASTSPAARAQALIGGNGFQGGFAVNGMNNGVGFNNGFGGFNNGVGGGFNGFAPVAAVGGGFGPMGFNNGNAVAFGFGGPMNGGMAMSYGPGMGFNGNFGGQQGFGFNPMGVPMMPPAFAANNLGGIATVIDRQVVRRPGGALPAVRRRRR